MTDVQAVMGHANISMSEPYTHSTPEGQIRVCDYMKQFRPLNFVFELFSNFYKEKNY